jgi:hypothetical protein
LASSHATLRLLDVSGGDAKAVRRLLTIAKSMVETSRDAGQAR